jgi:hypothetical protein
VLEVRVVRAAEAQVLTLAVTPTAVRHLHQVKEMLVVKVIINLAYTAD